MRLYLLGVSRSRDVGRWGPERGAGSREQGAPSFRWLACKQLAAAVWTEPALPLPLQHAAALAAIHRHGDVLPMRFGASLPDEHAVSDLLHCRQTEWVEELDRLAGAEEVGVRIEVPPSPPLPTNLRSVPGEGRGEGKLLVGPPLPPGEGRGEGEAGTRLPSPSPLTPGYPLAGASPGTMRSMVGSEEPSAYLASRRARYREQDDQCRRAEQVAEDCVRTVAGLYCQWRRLRPEPPGTVRLAFLVERHRSAALTKRLARLRARRIEQQFTVLGPWPPYSFALR